MLGNSVANVNQSSLRVHFPRRPLYDDRPIPPGVEILMELGAKVGNRWGTILERRVPVRFMSRFRAPFSSSHCASLLPAIPPIAGKT